MRTRSEDPTVTARWTREGEDAGDDDETVIARPTASRRIEEPFAELDDDALDALLDGSRMNALAAPRTPVEMWALVDDEPPPCDDPHETEDGTLFLVAPPAPPAVHRPQTMIPPARLVALPPPIAIPLAMPMPMHAPSSPAYDWRVPPPARPGPWRARAILGSVGAIAFGAAMLAGLWYGGSIAAAPTEPEPLFGPNAMLPASSAAATTPAASASPDATAATTPVPAATARPSLRPESTAQRSAPRGNVAQVSFAVAAPPPEPKTAKTAAAKAEALADLLDKLGEEQLRR